MVGNGIVPTVPIENSNRACALLMQGTSFADIV